MKMNREIKFIAVVALGLLLLPAFGAHAAMLAVTSVTNGAGLYQYHVARSSDPFLLGGTPELLSFVVRAYHVIGVDSPPGWTASLLTTNTITWRCTNTTTVIINTNALIFTVTSAMDAIPYDDLADDALYPRGICAGEVYSTNATPVTALQDDYVGTINLAGYERFAYLGPIVPEPACGLVLLICGLVGRRAKIRLRSFGVSVLQSVVPLC